MIQKSYRVPAVLKSLDILELLGRSGQASLTEICTRLGLPKSSAYQILQTLASRGYVRHVGSSAAYSLGLSLFELGNQAVGQLDLRDEARPILRELVAQTHQTGHLGILDGQQGMYLVKVDGDRAVRLNSWEGKRLPLHSTSIGKALLAWIGDDAARLMLGPGPLPALTSATITDPEGLISHLEEVRRQGWALDDQENESHIRCLGAPIRDIHGQVAAAISLSGLASELVGEMLLDMAARTKAAAALISSRLGNKSA